MRTASLTNAVTDVPLSAAVTLNFLAVSGSR